MNVQMKWMNASNDKPRCQSIVTETQNRTKNRKNTVKKTKTYHRKKRKVRKKLLEQEKKLKQRTISGQS